MLYSTNKSKTLSTHFLLLLVFFSHFTFSSPDRPTAFILGASLSAGFNADDAMGFYPLSAYLRKSLPRISIVDLTAASSKTGVFDLVSMMNKGFKQAMKQIDKARELTDSLAVSSDNSHAIAPDLFFWYFQKPELLPSGISEFDSVCSNHGLDWAGILLESYMPGKYIDFFNSDAINALPDSEKFLQRMEGMCMMMNHFQENFTSATVGTLPKIDINLLLLKFPSPPQEHLMIANDLIRSWALSQQYVLIDIAALHTKPYPIVAAPHIKRKDLMSKDGLHLNTRGMKHLSKMVESSLPLIFKPKRND